MNPLPLIGHIAVILFAVGMIGFFCMIFKGVKKVKKKGRKASRRVKRYNLWQKKFEEFKKNWFYEI